MKLVPKNWGAFQHYKNRCPPWIKLHRDILNDRDFMSLPTASKALAPLLWLLACEKNDGIFDASLEELEWRLRISKKEIKIGLESLLDMGFFIVSDGDASNVPAECLRDATPEERREEQKKEETKESAAQAFISFWSLYPKKTARADAMKAWEKLKPDESLLSSIMNALEFQTNSVDWQKDGGKFVPYPATWLNKRRWEDEQTKQSICETSNPFKGAL